MPKISLTTKEVKHIANLAKLSLSEKEIASFGIQLSEILAYVSKLKNIKTDFTTATNQVTGQENIFSSGGHQPLTKEEALSNTKNKEKNFFKIKAIL